jgi:hypothetical protein
MHHTALQRPLEQKSRQIVGENLLVRVGQRALTRHGAHGKDVRYVRTCPDMLGYLQTTCVFMCWNASGNVCAWILSRQRTSNQHENVWILSRQRYVTETMTHAKPLINEASTETRHTCRKEPIE